MNGRERKKRDQLMEDFCKLCGEFKYSRHRCPPQWKVWREAGDGGEDAAVVVYSDYPQSAATKFAHAECEGDQDFYGQYLYHDRGEGVLVRSVNGGPVSKFDVSGESEVTFFASEVHT